MTRKLLVTAAAVGALAISGTAFALTATSGPAVVASQPTPSTTSDSPTLSPSSSSATVPTSPGTVDAGTLAQQHLGGGTVTSVEREFEHGRAEWKVRITKDGIRHDIRLDATTGAVTRDDASEGSGRGGPDDKGGDDHGGHGSDDKGGDH